MAMSLMVRWDFIDRKLGPGSRRVVGRESRPRLNIGPAATDEGRTRLIPEADAPRPRREYVAHVARFPALVVVLLVAAEIAVVGGSSEGSTAVLYLFPLLWTLPLLLYRRAPEVAVLAVMGALAVEAHLAQPATESITALPSVMLAYWIAGTIDSRSRSVVVAMVAFALGIVVVAQNPGPFGASDAVFLAIAAGAPFTAGSALRERDRRAEEVEREREARRPRRRGRGARAHRARTARRRRPLVSVMMVQAGAGADAGRERSGRRHARRLLEDRADRARRRSRRCARMLGVLRDDRRRLTGSRRSPASGTSTSSSRDARAAGSDVDARRRG